MFREQQGKVVAGADHSFCFGELERATAILEHFVDLVARDGYDSRSEKLCSSDHGFVGMHLDKLSILFGLFLTWRADSVVGYRNTVL